MDFELTKSQKLFQQMIREFAEKEVKPIAAEVDEEEKFPTENVKKLGALGVLGIPTPKKYGGAGGDHVMYTVA
ncbi:MAG: acyl-CoA dehydrogenase family protein, partial [Bacteroidales bacterium]|nr:acyl-CoA dehydrogenase family protein [Bacteroidales bacterium]